MGEVQEKVWVVSRRYNDGPKFPVKAFDDRADARKYASRLNKATAAKYKYSVVGVLKG